MAKFRAILGDLRQYLAILGDFERYYAILRYIWDYIKIVI